MKRKFTNESAVKTLAECISKLRRFPDEEVAAKAEALVTNDCISKSTLLAAYTSAYVEWEHEDAVIANCLRVRAVIDHFACDYTNPAERFKFVSHAYDFFAWLIVGIEASMTRHAGLQRSVSTLVDALEDYSAQEIYQMFVYAFVNRTPEKRENIEKLLNKLLDSIENAREEFCRKNEELLKKIGYLRSYVTRLLEGPKPEIIRPSYVPMEQSHPGLLTLASIFSCFRPCDKDLEFAETFLMFSHTVGIKRVDMMVDILRTGPLLQLKETNFDRLALIDVFVYRRIPNIVLLLVECLDVKREIVNEAMKRFLGYKQLLKKVDILTVTNLFEYYVNCFEDTGLLTIDEANELRGERNHDYDECRELSQIHPDADQSRLRFYGQIEGVAQSIATVLEQDDDQVFITTVDKLLVETDGTLEIALGIFCAMGVISDFTVRIMRINHHCESPIESQFNDTVRLSMYNLTFLILIKIKYIFVDVQLHEIIAVQESCFLQWWNAYELAMVNNTPVTGDAENKDTYLKQFSTLRNEHPFWDLESNVEYAITSMAGVGEVMIEQCQRYFTDVSSVIPQIIIGLSTLPCLLVCLVQVLDTQQGVECQPELAKRIRDVLNCGDPSYSRYFQLAIHIVQPLLDMQTQRRHHELPYTWVVIAARRLLPSLRYMQLPSEQMLKEAYIYGNHQCWASPAVLVLIDRCNRVGCYRLWIKCWLQQVMKSCTADEVAASTELILATACITPVVALAETLQQVVDMMLTLDEEGTYKNAINHYCSRAMGALIVKCIILLFYAEERRLQKLQTKGSTSKNSKRTTIDDEEAEAAPKSPELEEVVDEAMMRADCEAVKAYEDVGEPFYLDEEPIPEGKYWPHNENLRSMGPTLFQDTKDIKLTRANAATLTIVITFHRFQKEIKVAALRPPVVFIAHLMSCLAAVPRSRFWNKCVQLIVPFDLFIHLARLEPFSLRFTEMLRLHDIRRPQNVERVVQYACLLRKLGVF